MAAGDKFNGPYCVSGETVGSASAVVVPLDFRPIYIELINKTNKSIAYWTPGHGVAGCTKVVDSGVGTTDISTVTTNGVTVGSAGFTIGTDTGINNASDVIYYTAWRSY